MWNIAYNVQLKNECQNTPGEYIFPTHYCNRPSGKRTYTKINLQSNNNRECCSTDMSVVWLLVILSELRSPFVHIIQVKVLFRWRLKLIVVISLSNHMMSSQDHMCVQCVTNGSRGNTTWNVTHNYILEKSCIHVPSVTNILLLRITW